jgi:hypothetical protein
MVVGDVTVQCQAGEREGGWRPRAEVLEALLGGRQTELSGERPAQAPKDLKVA